MRIHILKSVYIACQISSSFRNLVDLEFYTAVYQSAASVELVVY